MHLRRTTIFLHAGHMVALDKLARSRGLRNAHLVRLAILEYLRRETRKK
jgi:hypothetical protein